jgi:hypothetical protein
MDDKERQEQEREGSRRGRGEQPPLVVIHLEYTAHSPYPITVVVVAYPLVRHLHLAFLLFLIFPQFATI